MREFAPIRKRGCTAIREREHAHDFLAEMLEDPATAGSLEDVVKYREEACALGDGDSCQRAIEHLSKLDADDTRIEALRERACHLATEETVPCKP